MIKYESYKSLLKIYDEISIIIKILTRLSFILSVYKSEFSSQYNESKYKNFINSIISSDSRSLKQTDIHLLMQKILNFNTKFPRVFKRIAKDIAEKKAFRIKNIIDDVIDYYKENEKQILIIENNVYDESHLIRIFLERRDNADSYRWFSEKPLQINHTIENICKSNIIMEMSIFKDRMLEIKRASTSGDSKDNINNIINLINYYKTIPHNLIHKYSPNVIEEYFDGDETYHALHVGDGGDGGYVGNICDYILNQFKKDPRSSIILSRIITNNRSINDFNLYYERIGVNVDKTLITKFVDICQVKELKTTESFIINELLLKMINPKWFAPSFSKDNKFHTIALVIKLISLGSIDDICEFIKFINDQSTQSFLKYNFRIAIIDKFNKFRESNPNPILVKHLERISASGKLRYDSFVESFVIPPQSTMKDDLEVTKYDIIIINAIDSLIDKLFSSNVDKSFIKCLGDIRIESIIDYIKSPTDSNANGLKTNVFKWV